MVSIIVYDEPWYNIKNSCVLISVVTSAWSTTIWYVTVQAKPCSEAEVQIKRAWGVRVCAAAHSSGSCYHSSSSWLGAMGPSGEFVKFVTDSAQVPDIGI